MRAKSADAHPNVGASISRTGTLLLVVASSWRSAAGLVVAFVLTRVFSQDDFAGFRGSQVVAMVASTVAAAGLPQTLLFLIPTSDSDRARLLGRITLLQVLAAAVSISLLLALGAGAIASAFTSIGSVDLLRAAALYTFGQSLALGAPNLAVARGRLGLAAWIETLGGASILIGTVVPVLMGAGPVGALWTSGAVLAVVGATSWLMQILRGGALWWDRELARQQWSLAVPQSLSSILGGTLQQLDKLIVAGLFPPAEFAVYACGAIEVPLITLVPFVLTKAVSPGLASRFGAGDVQGFLNTWHRQIRVAEIVVLPTALLMWWLAPTIMSSLYPPAYADAVGPFRIFLLLLPLRFSALGMVLQSTGRTGPVLVATVVGLSATALSVAVLGNVAGSLGAAVGAVVGQVASIIVHLVAIRRSLATSYASLLPWDFLGRLVLSVAIAVGVRLLAAQSLGPATSVIAAMLALLTAGALTGAIRWADLRVWGRDAAGVSAASNANKTTSVTGANRD